MRSPEKMCEPLKRSSCQSRRIIISVFFLLLLIQLPVGSQTPAPRIFPRAFIAPTTPPPNEGHVLSPAVPTGSQTIQPSATKPRPLYSASATATAAPAATRSTKWTLPRKNFNPPHPTATPPWREDSVPWKYVIPALIVAVLIVGFLLLRNGNGEEFEPDRLAAPTFHLHSDQATPQKPPENIAINYQLRFDPNLSQSSHWLETNGANLIISRRKEI